MKRNIILLGGAAAFLFLLMLIGGLLLATQTPEKSETYSYHMSLLDPPIQIADFSLPATTGTTFSLSQQQGNLILLYFGYTSCPDFCPTALAKLTRVMSELGQVGERVKVVFVTGDLERDTPERMTRYLAGFDPRFIGVIPPTQAELQSLLDQFYAVAMRVEEPNSALGYVIQHTTTLFVIDEQGRWIGRYPYETSFQDIVEDIRHLSEERVQ